MKKTYFVISLLLIDLLFSQIFLLEILEKDLIRANKESFENRVSDENYNYTFKKQVQFTSQYDGNIYNIFTNDLGFRDDRIKKLDRKKLFR